MNWKEWVGILLLMGYFISGEKGNIEIIITTIGGGIAFIIWGIISDRKKNNKGTKI